MIRSLWTAATGMQAQQMNMDVIANNLANLQTPGFKKSNLEFEDMIYHTAQAPGAKLSDGSIVATGLQVGYGSHAVATSRAFTQGDMQQTGNKLDVAIQGAGFFQVLLSDGTYGYTRDGSFKLNSEGSIVTDQGYKLNGASQVPQGTTDITIGKDGTMSVTVNGKVQGLSPILLSNFPNPDGLRSIGGNIFQETDASGAAQTGQVPGQNGVGTLGQGFVEMSNVSVVDEMVKMIQAQRAYEINSKAIQSADDMMGMANNLRRG